MRWWPWWLLLLATSRAACDAAEDEAVRNADGKLWSRAKASLGFPATIARALNRIRSSRRDVRLTDDLWFETLRSDGNALKSPTESPPADLLRLTDAVFDTHRLSWHNALLQGMDINVYKDRTRRYVFNVTRNMDGENPQNPDTRTFGGGRRRLQLIMLPIVYKLGVITTLLTGLTVLSLKGVTIGVILLILAVTSIATKASKFNHYAAAASYGPAMSLYDPFDRSSQPVPHPSLDKNIHVHVHTGPGSSAPNAAYKGPVATYDHAANDDGVYWNKSGDEYYDAAMNQNYNYASYNYPSGGSSYRRPGDGGAESTTSSSYNRWLG